MMPNSSSINIFPRIFIICGILAAFLFIGTDLIAGFLKPGYRFDSQSISVLSAFGTSTRPYVLPCNVIAEILLIAFSLGIWFSANHNWVMRATAVLLAVNAIFAIIAIIFYPWHIEEAVNAHANKMNVLFMGTSVVLFFLALCFGAAANNNWFRYFSIGLIILFFILDILATAGTKFAFGGAPGPKVGIQERSMFFGELLWVVLQAITLLHM